jgi:PRTRC genetic system protein C
MATLVLPNPSALATPVRWFRMGAIELPDIAPELSPLAALRQYVHQWPHLKRAHLAEPVVEGDRLIYEVEKPVVQTKG